MPARNPHASTEQLADLLAGVLADAEAGSVAAHASECAQCGAERDLSLIHISEPTRPY